MHSIAYTVRLFIVMWDRMAFKDIVTVLKVEPPFEYTIPSFCVITVVLRKVKIQVELDSGEVDMSRNPVQKAVMQIYSNAQDLAEVA